MKTISRNTLRLRRKRRVRVMGTERRPRLSVFRSLRAISVQVINDENGTTLASAVSSELPKGKRGLTMESAAKVGALIADRCKEKNIIDVVFDRGGYKYHGRIKSLADAARKGGLKF